MVKREKDLVTFDPALKKFVVRSRPLIHHAIRIDRCGDVECEPAAAMHSGVHRGVHNPR